MRALKIQEIQVGEERAVIVPLETWKILLERIEELEDERFYDEAVADQDSSTIDHAEFCRQLGRSPLRYLRSRAGMTQTELARRTQLSQSYIAKVEASAKRLSESTREKVACVLGISASELEY